MNAADRVRELVKARCGGNCEICGTNLYYSPASVHHRRPRGMGGTTTVDAPSNLLVLCGSGTTGCHGRVERDRGYAYALGWLIRSHDQRNPADVPYYSEALDGFVLVNDHGGDEVWSMDEFVAAIRRKALMC